jgi:DNA helicase-2/ATP-dependent DNA helicase PcrA
MGVDDLGADQAGPAEIKPRAPDATSHASFSELKYLFECLYQFKLRFLYGFNAPLHEALRYGKGLHDALSEIHKRARDGDLVTKASAASLMDRHLNAPFAYPALREQLRNAGIKAIERYFDTHGKE